MTDNEHRDQERQMELIGCRDHLRDAQEALTRIQGETGSPELAEAHAKVTEAMDALRRYGHDGRWGE